MAIEWTKQVPKKLRLLVDGDCVNVFSAQAPTREATIEDLVAAINAMPAVDAHELLKQTTAWQNMESHLRDIIAEWVQRYDTLKGAQEHDQTH